MITYRKIYIDEEYRKYMEANLTNLKEVVDRAREAKKNNSKVLMNYSEAYQGETA